MSKPTEVYVAPFWYEVYYDENLRVSAGVLGACNTDQQKILMDPTQGGEVFWETLLHEMLHAAWTQTALDKTYTGEQEEEIIFTMSPRLVAILKDNPVVVRGITRKRRT